MHRYLVLAIAALAAFGDCLRGSFHFDDYSILSNPAGQPWILQTRPLTQLTFWLNFQLGGTNPVGYHLINLLLHIAVVCLLFQALQEVIPQDAAFLGAGLFAIHPIQAETVAYVFARGTLLATLFCLLCWRSWQHDKRWQAVAWFAVALLCKEECVTFPFVLLLVGRRYWKPAAVMFGWAVATGLHTLYATRAIMGSGAGFSAGTSPLEYMAAQGAVVLRYFRLFLLPWGFTIDPEIRVAPWDEMLAWAVLISMIFFASRFACPGVWFLSGLLLLIPSSSIFPAADLAADRRMYLPMIAFCAAVGVLVHSLARKSTSIRIALAAFVLVALSIGRMEVWRTEQSLWREAVERSPDKLRPRIQLARAIPPAEALAVLKPAPATADVVTERGRVYLDLGKPADALREFGQALALRPGDAHAINNRGAALLALGQREAAKHDFERALTIDPALQDARQNLARITSAEK